MAQLSESVARVIVEFAKLPGIGKKSAATIHEALKTTSADEDRKKEVRKTTKGRKRFRGGKA